VVLLTEILHEFHRSTISTAMLKVDFEKAFDELDKTLHQFLLMKGFQLGN
jgi:hypothetical protein